MPPRLQDVTDDHIRMHKVLQESGLKYVAVMPPHIGKWGWHPGTGLPPACPLPSDGEICQAFPGLCKIANLPPALSILFLAWVYLLSNTLFCDLCLTNHPKFRNVKQPLFSILF